MKTIIAAAAFAVLATPAVAQTMPIVIQYGQADRVVNRTPLTLQERIADAAEAACERPFIRNLSARAHYFDCLAEARAQVEARWSNRPPVGDLALR